MTDFGSHLKKRGKRAKAQSKWRDLLAICFTVFLVVLIVNGFLRGIRLKGSFSNSIWDGKTPLAIALDSNPPALVVVQKEPKRVLFLKIDKDLSFATGKSDEPVKSVEAGFDDQAGGRKFTAKLLGVNVPAYIELKQPVSLNREQADEIFKDFAFFTIPISIFFNGLDDQISSTNLSRLDLVRVWWLIKDVNVDQVSYVDSLDYAVDVIGINEEKFRGIDREMIRKFLSKYFEDYRMVGKNVEVNINNASGENGLGTLASEMAQIAGFDITEVSSSDTVQSKTQVVVGGKKSEASYLAKMFNCDIVPLQNESEELKVTLILGRDFAKGF